MNFIVDPSPRLLYSECSPFAFREQFSFVGYPLVDVLGQNDVPVLIILVTVFFRILNFGGIMRHIDYSK